MEEPGSIALIEIMLGSRSDPELDSRFAQVFRDLEQQLIAGPLAIAKDVGIEDAEPVEAMCRLHLAAMRGLIINRLFEKGEKKMEQAYDLLKWYKAKLEADFFEEDTKL